MKTYAPLFAALLLVTTSCDSPFEDSGNQLRQIEGRVLLSIQSKYPDSGWSQPHPYLEIETEQEYPCFNYDIAYNSHHSGNVFGLALKGASIGSICAPAFGPARLSHPLSVDNGTYTIQIMMNNAVGIHTLVATDSAFYLYGESDISAPKDSLFPRFPPSLF